MTSPSRQLLVGSRWSAGLSQAQAARRAGIPRSVLNAYERGRREPGVDAMVRVLSATGRELRSVPATRRLDAERAGRILAQVLDLAEALPSRRRRPLPSSPFRPLET